MLARSLTLAALFAFAAPLFAADSDAPLAKEQGKARPLVVIASSSADVTLRALQKDLEDPAVAAEFKKRDLVLYSVASMMGKREDKHLEQQATMALIRELQLGASKGTKVILVDKTGQRHMLKDDEVRERLDPKVIFAAVDALPASEQASAAPAAATPAQPAADSKPARPAKPAAPPKPLED